jgi:hypothetical protein
MRLLLSVQSLSRVHEFQTYSRRCRRSVKGCISNEDRNLGGGVCDVQ